MSPEVWVAVGTGALVVVTGGFVATTLMGIREQLWLATFTEYTRRYSDIMDSLPFEARQPTARWDLDQVTTTERAAALGVMRRYLNLCSEEHYLVTRGKIDHQTWAIWTSGIRDTVRLPWFPDAWTILRSEYASVPDFCEFMDQLVTPVTRNARTSAT
jgi:hypothetical protein